MCVTWKTVSRAPKSGLCKRRFDPRPIVERGFLTGDDRDHDLVPAGAPEGFDALGQLLLGCGEGGAADQLGGDEFLFLGLYEDEMAAMVSEVARIRRREILRQLEIAVLTSSRMPS